MVMQRDIETNAVNENKFRRLHSEGASFKCLDSGPGYSCSMRLSHRLKLIQVEKVLCTSSLCSPTLSKPVTSCDNHLAFHTFNMR